MRHSNLVSTLLVAGLLLPGAAPAGGGSGYGYGTSTDREHGLGWAIVSDDNTSMSDASDLDSIDRLKETFGPEFLYVRDGRTRYVIRDHRMVERAREANQSIQKYGKEIGIIARAQVQEALGNSRHAQRNAKLQRRQAELARRIARRVRNGESTEALEREIEAITEAMVSDEMTDASARSSKAQRRDLQRQQDEAQRKLQKAVDHIRSEIHDILDEAIEDNLATQLH